MDKSDTPRTEQMIDSCGDYEKAYHYKGRFANFARGLESEVTALTAANADLTAQLAEARSIAWEWGQGVDDAEAAIRKLSRMFPIDAMKEPK